MTENRITEEDWKIIEDRLKSMPEGFEIGILEQSLSKENLLKAIQERNPVGEEYVKMQIEYIKWLAKQSKIA